MKQMIRPLVGLGLAVGLAVLGGCASEVQRLEFGFDRAGAEGQAGLELQTGAFPAYPDLRLVHVSDTHLYSPELGVSGQAFQDYLNHDRKLLAQSTEILAAVQPEMVAARPDLVIVSGDLTKDGERLNHEAMAAWCAGLEAAGVPVYVVPGNHDINNPHARRFAGDKTEAVDQVDPAAFAAIYRDFGYAEALERDPASLSYLAQPREGLWLLALDSADYEDNHKLDTPVTAGRLRPATLVWLEAVLQRARAQGMAVMATMHHGLVEHWPGQKQFAPEYVVAHDQDVQRLFAHYGVRLVFTGHFHSQDIAKAVQPDGSFVYDIETGSMMTWPLPWRVLDFKAGQLELRTREVAAIASMPEGFGQFARDFTANGIATIARGVAARFGVPAKEAEQLAAQSVQAFLTHYQGDEVAPTDRPVPDRRGLGLMANLILDRLEFAFRGMYRDSPAADRNLVIDLARGSETSL